MSYPVFDMHCDTADRLAWQFLPDDIKQTCGMDFYGPGDADDPSACRDLASSHCHISLDKIGAIPWAQCFACYVPDALSPEQATGFHEGVMSHLTHEVERNVGRVVAVASASQLRDVLENSGEPHVTAVHTIENARMFAADLGLVERYAADGLLMASISWNAAGPLASGHDTHEHVSGHRRNLTDRQFAEIRERGGVVGLNYCDKFLSNEVLEGHAADVSFDEVAAHIEHWLDLGGEDVVALGGDLDGATVPSLLDGADKMPAFQGLLEHRFGSTITRKLCYANALAFFERMELPA